MAVGENEAVGREDHAGSRAERQLARRLRMGLTALPHLQMDDRRRNAFDRCRDCL